MAENFYKSHVSCVIDQPFLTFKSVTNNAKYQSGILKVAQMGG